MKNHPILLTAAAEEAFYTLKKKCATAPILTFADLKRPFLLETDASKYCLGVVLQQVQEDGKYHPVAYASCTLRGSKANYHVLKLEFLALMLAMTQQFKEYLMYQPFTMRTDNNPLDENATNEFLPSLDESSYDAKNVSDNARKENAWPMTKVEKNAVNEIMERA